MSSTIASGSLCVILLCLVAPRAGTAYRLAEQTPWPSNFSTRQWESRRLSCVLAQRPSICIMSNRLWELRGGASKVSPAGFARWLQERLRVHGSPHRHRGCESTTRAKRDQPEPPAPDCRVMTRLAREPARSRSPQSALPSI